MIRFWSAINLAKTLDLIFLKNITLSPYVNIPIINQIYAKLLVKGDCVKCLFSDRSCKSLRKYYAPELAQIRSFFLLEKLFMRCWYRVVIGMPHIYFLINMQSLNMGVSLSLPPAFYILQVYITWLTPFTEQTQRSCAITDMNYSH